MEPTATDNQGLLEERCRRLENQISTLKNVSQLRRTLLELRERQVKDLISKLKFYEVIVTEERESRHSLSIRLESAESQCSQLTEKLAQNLHSIEEMKANYETKVSTLINELQISEQRNQQLSDQLNCAQLRISEVTRDSTIEELSKKLEEKDKFTRELQNQMKRVWERNKALSYQMSLLNNLFSETEGVTIDFEKIKAIGDIVRESQALSGESEDEVLSDDPSSERGHAFDFENLLDSIEKSENVMPAEIPGEESCYKSVDTKRGPQLVLSVSRTFIKLKDLIVEKKSLQKEIETLKTLNTKLESKVDKQEHRLYRVTMELNKTWSLVSKLKQQHKRLYNSEAVLRYELQEKRTLLDKLKNELSASREKWRRVRQKNSQSQIEWEKLRDEFAQRKHQSSQESGTFSEVMSVSSGENDAATLEEEVEQTAVRSRRSSKPKCRRSTNDSEDDDEEGPEEDEYEDGARALSPMEDEHYEDPLEELVSNLVAEIENETYTEEESSTSREEPAPPPPPPPPPENESSPSPDFEDRMRRRANRLRMLEEQCHNLHTKLQASTARSEALSTKLAELHDHYGPSGSSTETPSDDQNQNHPQQNEQNGDASQNQEDADVTHPQTHSSVNDDEVSTASTDAAYVSGTENNSVREESIGAKSLDTPTTTENNATSFSCSSPEYNANVESDPNTQGNKLIDMSENSTINAPLSTSENNDHDDDHSSNNKSNINENATGQESQGHSDITEKRNNESALLAVAIPIPSTSCPPLEDKVTENAVSEEEIAHNSSKPDENTNPDTPFNSELISDSSRNDSSVGIDNTNAIVNSSDITTTQNEEQSQAHHFTEVEQSSVPQLNGADSHAELETQDISSSPPLEEDPLSIQETVVQHFPSTSEEEANEFVPVQIRPEFLRILQEADEATNSLDWMPSLLTITHSVALLRLDPELPSTANDGNNRSNVENTMGNGSRSLSESLRIEIPQLTPSPPLPPDNTRENGAGARTRQNHQETNETSSNSRSSEAEEHLPAYAKDPSFLSRMIIKQLPKRLQLLKNENHTLQMETAEAKMRMKEMTRQLAKEIDKQQQMSISLDAQIEEKNLIEFELREEIEKKEKVIEELQMEMDESNKYADELKMEREEIDAKLQVFLQEKMDMEQPKVPLDSVKNCHNCKRTFTLLTRRKLHCKICANVFCKDCAILREPGKRSSKRPRLCTRCHFRRQRLISLVNASKQSDTTVDPN